MLAANVKVVPVGTGGAAMVNGLWFGTAAAVALAVQCFQEAAGDSITFWQLLLNAQRRKVQA